MKKKFIILILVTLVLVGCGSPKIINDNTREQNKLNELNAGIVYDGENIYYFDDFEMGIVKVNKNTLTSKVIVRTDGYAEQLQSVEDKIIYLENEKIRCVTFNGEDCTQQYFSDLYYNYSHFQYYSNLYVMSKGIVVHVTRDKCESEECSYYIYYDLETKDVTKLDIPDEQYVYQQEKNIDFCKIDFFADEDNILYYSRTILDTEYNWCKLEILRMNVYTNENDYIYYTTGDSNVINCRLAVIDGFLYRSGYGFVSIFKKGNELGERYSEYIDVDDEKNYWIGQYDDEYLYIKSDNYDLGRSIYRIDRESFEIEEIAYVGDYSCELVKVGDMLYCGNPVNPVVTYDLSADK